MKVYLKYFILLLLFSNCQKKETTKPKLIVGIVVDQMRYDYLVKFKSRFGDDGFNKLIASGYNYTNFYLNHTPTHTAVGHASIYTGTTPEYHGVIGNNWYDKKSKQSIYCVEDSAYTSIGTEENLLGKSPKQLLANTITDQLHIAQNMQGKTISISLKDRAAIIPGGHSANAAYWFEGNNSGRWISSSYYMNELPEWVKDFNNKNNPEKLLNNDWETYYNLDSYSGQDNSIYELPFKGEKAPIFPHKITELRNSNNNFSILNHIPVGNTLTTLFSIEAIKKEQLGTSDYTDFLSISYSATDYIGHQFGIESIEVEDTYIRMDLELKKLLSFLDSNVGKDNYLVFLTSDHGASNSPNYFSENKLPGKYRSHLELVKTIKNLSIKHFGSDVIEHIENNNIYLNEEKLKLLKIEKKYAIELLSDQIIQIENINKVYTKQNLKNTDRISTAIKNGFNSKKSGDLIYLENFNTIPDWYLQGGTTHGTPYNYDTHIPLVLYGNSIKKGTSSNYHTVIDLVPTLCHLLAIEQPNGCTGNIIHELY